MALEMAKYIGVTIFFIFVSYSSRNILCHMIVPHPMHRAHRFLPEVLLYRAPRGYFLKCTRLQRARTSPAKVSR